MSGSYAVGTNYLSFTSGTAGATGSGAYTIVVLAQPAIGNNGAGMCGLYTSGSANRDLFEDSLALFGQNDFSSGFGALTQGNWYVCAQTKDAGSNTYRHHFWAYASDGSGTMSHGVATGSATHGDGSAITEIRIGATEVPANGLIAAIAIWTVALSDADLDGFKSANLSSWTTSGSGQPKELISLENWNGTTGASVLIGTSSYSSTTGTVSSGANPPSFSFALTAPSTLTAAPFQGIAPGMISPSGRFRAGPFVPLSGQTVSRSVAGASTPAGALAKQAQKPLAAASASSGTLARQDQKALAGTSAPSGAAAKQDQKATAGASASSGAATRQAQKGLAGSGSPAGAVAKAAAKALSAASAPAGALAKLTAKALTSSSGSSGAAAFTRVILRTFGGSSTPIGSLARVIAKALSAASTPSGALSRSGGAGDTKADSTASVADRRTSTGTVAAHRSAAAAVTDRRTSNGGVT